ncbi:MAG: T9SS type A sorting domain-containing protein [Melioribacteraceae bacterium]|nr:T9SS type A sorting domain-containing protein [Melioribacteraceae bacterium]MCF8353710.1 T9SS type A sorting domain-containing protein [Melioribacteraceae bacterium]MCF8394963.1 T9SS type A sorting domain-containing protein [Melioribacteraceae bacterium]MCF8418626.1 T9SS type A sorting domain-containing protein [Melioribacteraceae bacterium]
MYKKVLPIVVFLISFGIMFTTLNFISDDAVKPAKSNSGEPELMSQKKQFVKGYLKQDSPDLFEEYHFKIRTRDGEDAPSYQTNYQIKELLKAKGVSSIRELYEVSGIKEFNTATSAVFKERGPGNIGGRSRGVAIDPDDPNFDTWFVASVGGGVWKTTDAGNTWRHLTKNITNLATSTIAMANSNPDVIYVGTGEGFGNVDQMDGTGMWKTTDRGETWFQLESTTIKDFQNIMRIVVDPANENIVIAATTSGFHYSGTSGALSQIFKSVDGGETWTSVYTSSSADVQQIVPDPGNFNILYAPVDGQGILRSTNAGNSWSLFFAASQSGRIEMAVSPVDSKRIYAAAVGGSTGTRYYVSTNSGSTWNTIDAEINWLGGQGWYDNTIEADPYDIDVAYVGGINLWKVRYNSGTSLTLTNITDGYGQFGGSSKGVHVDHHGIYVVKTNEATESFRLINTNDGGVAYSDDKGETFEQPINGFNTSQFYGIDKKNGADEYVGGMQDNSTWRSPSGVSSDSTTLWLSQWGGDGYETSWKYDDPNKILVSSQYNGIGRSLNGGASYTGIWSFAPEMTDRGSGKAPFMTKIAKSNSNPDLIFVVGSSGVWRSADFADSFRLIPTSVEGENIGSASSWVDLKIHMANPNIVWVGQNLGGAGGIYYSINAGLSFFEAAGYSEAPLGNITGLETHPTDENTAFALFSFADGPKILRTTNMGGSWEDISGFGTGDESTTGFPDVATYSLVVMPFDTDIMWAGTEIGLFETTDGGASWNIIDEFPSVSVYFMTIVNDQVVIGTHGRGVWSATLAELSGYTPPDYIEAPVLNSVSLSSEGIEFDVDYSAVYDSVQLLINEEPVETILGNTVGNSIETIQFSPPETNEYTFGMRAFDGDKNVFTEFFIETLFAFSEPIESYATDFQVYDDNFYGEDFSVKVEFGFSGDGAMHSRHPYRDDATISYTLLDPIVVKSVDAFLNYRDIAIVEPGNDYVVVEGSLDGYAWSELIEPYDASSDSAWLNNYNNGGRLYEIYKQQSINLLDFFNPEDTILVRFKLSASGSTNAWGWAIDDLEIQEYLTGVEDEAIPAKYSLMQNYPNPFNPSTTISFTLPERTDVSLKIYDGIGREVAALVNTQLSAGKYNFNWNADNAASGVYYYRLTTNGFTETRKMLLLK